MESDLLALLRSSGALLEGHFLLSSGLHSSRYLQCARVLMQPDVATQLGAQLAMALRPDLDAELPHAVVSPAMGGVIVGHEVARAFGIAALFTERSEGVMSLRRGFVLEPGQEVIVVEDVITTGGSTREVMDVVRSKGAAVLAVGSLVDRSNGTVDLGVPRRSLLQLDVPSYKAEECPLCRAGSTPQKPGSRTPPRHA